MSSEQPGAEDRIDLSGLGRLADRPPPPRGEKAGRIIRVLSVLLLAVAAAGLPWYFVTRGGDGGSPRAGATSTPPTTSTSPSPSPSATAGTFEVFGVERCVNVRAEPTTSSKRLDCVTLGVQLRSDGRTGEGDGLLWRHIYDPFAKMWGWVADQYLKPVG